MRSEWWKPWVEGEESQTVAWVRQNAPKSTSPLFLHVATHAYVPACECAVSGDALEIPR